MPPITPMPSAAAPRQTDPDDHTDCAARITVQFAQGVAPWPRPGTPAARVPGEPHQHAAAWRAAPEKELSDGVGA